MSLEDKIKKAKPTYWVVEGIPKWKVWLIIKWARIRRERGRMKNCNKCEYNNYNIDDFEHKIFRCDRDKTKKYNYPKMHGWCCKHYVNKIIGRREDVKKD